MNHRILRKIFSFPSLLGFSLATAAFAAARLAIADPDTWWHLKVGEEILRTGTWPTADHYSFTVAGNPWMAYEWLGEVLMALAGRVGGLTALTGLLIALCMILLLLLYGYAYLRSGNSKSAFFACAVLVPLAAGSFTLRPQLLGYIFLLLTLLCLEAFRQGHKHVLWALPPLFLVWVNTHGTFVFGLLALSLYWLGGLYEFHREGLEAKRWTQSERKLCLNVGLVSALVLPLTPYGARLAAYPLELAFFQGVNVGNISEWQPMPFDIFWGKFFIVLVLGFFIHQIVFPVTFRIEEMALVCFAAYAATVHRRFILFFVLAFAPLLAVALNRWVSRYKPEKDRPLLNAMLMIGIVVGMFFFIPSRATLERTVTGRFPRSAVTYLKQHDVGPMLNEYGWGGYLIWALYPEKSVFIDGRADLYEYAGVLSDYLAITRLSPNARTLLQKYGIETCLLRRDAPLATLLAGLPEWNPVYSDELSVIYVLGSKNKPGSAAPTGTLTSDGSAASPSSNNDRH